MISGAIFDLDGVIIDSLSIWKDLGKKYLLKKGIEAEKNLSQILFSMSMQEGVEYIKKRYEIQESEQKILQEIEDMLEDFYCNEAPLKDEIKEVLEFLKANNIPMAIATSSPRKHTISTLKRNNIFNFFENRIFTSDEIGTSKNEPDIYFCAAESIGCIPKEILVFEDSIYALKTADKAGFICIGVFDAYGEKNQLEVKENSKFYIEKFSDFKYKWIEINS